MKILLVLDQYDSANNGNTITARRLASNLRNNGHEVRILAYGNSIEIEIWWLDEFVLPIFDKLVKKQGFIFAKPDKKIVEEAVAWADIVHMVMPFMICRAATKECLRTNKPMTSAFHVQPENIWYSVNLGNWKWLINRTYALAKWNVFKYHHFIHCPSRMIEKQLIDHGYKADIRVISNGIEPFFSYYKREKSDEFKGKFLIVMCGRFSHEKRQDILIDAIRKSKYSSKIQLVLAGKGPLDSVYKKRAEGMPNPVIFRFFSQEELKELYGQTDLYIHTSDAEFEAQSCMEAFATGLVPIISNSVERSATPQFALDERSLFLPGNSDDLAKKIDYWIEHEKERKEMELQYVELGKKYHIANCVTKMEEMFNDALKFYSSKN